MLDERRCMELVNVYYMNYKSITPLVGVNLTDLSLIIMIIISIERSI